jgi:hypothetical protein
MEGLGRVFNVIPVADNVYVNLKDASAVTFVCYIDGGDTFTLTEATSAGGGGAQVLATLTRYYTSSGVGTGTWTKRTQAAGSTVVTPDSTAQDAMVVTVNATELSDGFTHLKLASTSTGTVVAITHDLTVQRDPANLPAVSA